MPLRCLVVLIVFALCFPAEAQQPKKVPRIGVMAASPLDSSLSEAFRQGLRDLGYVEGENIIIEYRFAEGRPERLRDFAAELIRLKVNVIVTTGTPSTSAAKKATSTIPIVMANSADPVEGELIASLAHPGGNVTGLTRLSPQIAGKRLELIKEAFPSAIIIAVLWDQNNPSAVQHLNEMQAAADALGVQLQSVAVRGPDDFDKAFSEIAQKRAAALVVLRDAVFNFNQPRILEFATKRRLPTIFDRTTAADAGGLISYGANDTALYRRAAYYVDKILKGAKAGDLPVEQPTKFELVINLKTAKQIGVTIPSSVLYRVDKVIK